MNTRWRTLGKIALWWSGVSWLNVFLLMIFTKRMAQGDGELTTFAWLEFLVMMLIVLLAGTASFLGVLLGVLGMLPGQETKRYGIVAVLLALPIFVLLLYGALHPNIRQG